MKEIRWTRIKSIKLKENQVKIHWIKSTKSQRDAHECYFEELNDDSKYMKKTR